MMITEWEEIAALLTLGAMGFSLLLLFVGAWLSNKKSLEGRMMRVGSALAIPGAGLWLIFSNWVITADHFLWARSLEMQLIVMALLIGGGAALFSVGFMINRRNRPALPEGPAPYIPRGPDRLDS